MASPPLVAAIEVVVALLPAQILDLAALTLELLLLADLLLFEPPPLFVLRVEGVPDQRTSESTACRADRDSGTGVPRLVTHDRAEPGAEGGTGQGPCRRLVERL